MMGPRKIMSIIMGLIFLALGSLPLLNKLGVIGFAMPALPGIVLWILGVGGGIYLIIDGFHEITSMGMGHFAMVASFIVGIVILAFGLIPLLGAAGVIAFALPVIAEIIVNVLFILTGILLVAGGFVGI